MFNPCNPRADTQKGCARMKRRSLASLGRMSRNLGHTCNQFRDYVQKSDLM